MFDFPVWLILALASPLCWAIVHILDSYCVKNVFTQPWVGTATSSLTMLALLPFWCLGFLFADLKGVTPDIVVECVLAGAVFVISQATYFQALAKSEPGIVAAYWNLLPVILLVSSFFWTGQRLSSESYLGSLILVGSSVTFCLVDTNSSYRWTTFCLMFVGSWLQAIYFWLIEHIFRQCAVFPAFITIMVSMIVFGFIPLLFRPGRKEMSLNWPRIKSALVFLILIEVANLLAVASSQYAVEAGPAPLVATVEASLPAFTLGLSVLLYLSFGKFGDPKSFEHISTKLSLTLLMLIGIWLISR